jgi:RND family efflux transporter MFP subunit
MAIELPTMKPAPPPARARSAAAPAVKTEEAAAPSPSRGSAALVLQARALKFERFAPAAASVLADLGLLLGCERVSLGFYVQGRMKVVATSSGADTMQRRNFIAALAAAMEEAAEQQAAVVYPLPPGSTPGVCFAHTELERLNAGLSVCTVPIVGAQRTVGALLFERRGGFDARATEIAHDAAMFVGPILEMKHRLESPVAGRFIEAVSPRGPRLGGQAVAPWKVVWLAAATLAAVVAFWPVTFRVVAPARVEGIEQRILAAPVDGFIASVAARPGDAVRAGQVLGTLEDRDIALQRDKLAAEIGQLDKQYREALTREDAAQIVIARSMLEQAQAQHAIVERELERTQLKAPFDGVLIAGDLAPSKGMPVQRGQALLTVAPAQGYKVVAEVDEQDVTVLAAGQSARVLFAGLLQEPLPFTVTRISPVAVALDGRNVFEVEGRVADTDAQALRPGQRGMARIDVDQRLQAQVWWLRATHWLRRTSWQLMG